MEQEGDRWPTWYAAQGVCHEVANVACAQNIDPPVYTTTLLLSPHGTANTKILWLVALLVFLTTRLPLPWSDSSIRKLLWHIFFTVFLPRPQICSLRGMKCYQSPTACGKVIECAFGRPVRCPAQHPQKRMWVSKWRQVETSTVEKIAFYRTSITVTGGRGGVPQSASTFEEKFEP